jgi:hypothetical protein
MGSRDVRAEKATEPGDGLTSSDGRLDSALGGRGDVGVAVEHKNVGSV